MKYSLSEMQDRIAALDAALIEKNYSFPECGLTIEGSGPVNIWIKTGRHGEADRVFDGIEGDDLEGAFESAGRFVDRLEDMADHKKKQAVKQFGRAVDGLRDAGIEAKFVDPLSDTLKAMSENLLTHQPEAAQ